MKDTRPEFFLAFAAPEEQEEQIDNRVISDVPSLRTYSDRAFRTTGTLPRHEVSFMVYTTTGFVCLRTAIESDEKGDES